MRWERGGILRFAQDDRLRERRTDAALFWVVMAVLLVGAELAAARGLGAQSAERDGAGESGLALGFGAMEFAGAVAAWTRRTEEVRVGCGGAGRGSLGWS